MMEPKRTTESAREALLRPLAPIHAGREYVDVLATLSQQASIANYLEIGVSYGSLLQRMTCRHAVGVDPSFALRENVALHKSRVSLFQLKSDDFFAQFDRSMLRPGHFDLAMIDGLHLAEFVLRDFYNTERLCAPNSIIVIHDALPLTALMAMREATLIPELSIGTPFANWWTGDVWKIVPILKRYRPDLDVILTDAAPTGLVIVRRLDPTSTVLRENYARIIEEQIAIPDEAEGLRRLYDEIEIQPVAQIARELAATFAPQGESRPAWWRRWR